MQDLGCGSRMLTPIQDPGSKLELGMRLRDFEFGFGIVNSNQGYAGGAMGAGTKLGVTQ